MPLLKALLDNSPQIAHKIMDDGDIDDVSVNDVKVRDKIVVKPGEIVPVDSFIIKGSGLFDESSLTGESKPVETTAIVFFCCIKSFINL